MAYESKPSVLIARHGYSDTGGIIDSLVGAGKAIGAGAISIFGAKSKAEGSAAAYAEIAKQQAAANATPTWLMPAAVVGGGVLLVLALKKRKGKK